MNNKLIAFVIPSHLPGMGGWGNGYVAIPEGHPCFGKDYDQIYDEYNINVHGGLTFSDYSPGNPFPNETYNLFN